MYQFKIIKLQEGGYKFELEGIKLLVDDYSIVNDKHLLKTPNKTIAFFNIGDDVYGISNELPNLTTAEALYDSIIVQYNMLDPKNYVRHKPGNNHNLRQSA